MSAISAAFLAVRALRPRRAGLRLALLAACLLAPPAWGEPTREDALQALDRGDAAQRREAVIALGDTGTMADAEPLLDALHDADAGVRALAEQAVWRVWLRSGDADVDALMGAGIRHMEAGQLGAAVETFTRIIEKAPAFAEGWNKRATAYFLIGDYEQSLRDCDETLARNPSHFGALSGCGAILAQREELDRALEYFERALEINPNLTGIEQGLALVRQRLGRKGKQSI